MINRMDFSSFLNGDDSRKMGSDEVAEFLAPASSWLAVIKTCRNSAPETSRSIQPKGGLSRENRALGR